MAMVALVAHDAGGAEILSSWARRNGATCLLVAEGPAVAIFHRKCPELTPMPLEEAVAAADWLMCGSGWQSGLERDAIRAGRAASKKTVTFLDHWVNYRERFEENAELILPDEILVGDEEALRIAQAAFPRHPVRLEENPYVLELRDEIAAAELASQSDGSGSILYVCEPVEEHAERAYGNPHHFGYTEHEALKFFLDNVDRLDPDGRAIVVRPHPSETADKYSWAANASIRPISFSDGKTLLEETLAADVVVGCESMALFVAMLAGRRVVSAIPPGGRPCQLPHPGIEHLASLEAKARG